MRRILLPLRNLRQTSMAHLSQRFPFRRRRRVPVILQMNALECGLVCLMMILRYYGRQTTIAECRACMGTGRDGIAARTLAQVARSFGLRVKAFSLQGALDDFRYISLPAIVHWGFNHFVIVERWSPATVDIVDPARGRCRLSASEWEAGFTGVVLTMEPGAQFERRTLPPHTSWRTYLGHLLRIPGTRSVMTQVFAASLLLQILGLGVPVLTQVLIDRVLPVHLSSVMALLGIGMLVLVLSLAVITYLRSALLVYLQGRIDAQMMLGFFDHLLALPFRFFQERTTGDLLMRLSSNSTIRETLTSQMLSVVLDGVFVLISFIVVAIADAPMAALVLGLGALQLVLLWSTTGRMNHLMQQRLAAQSEAQSYMVEMLNGIGTLKASGAETRVYDRWSDLFFHQLNLSLRHSQISALVDTAMAGLRMLAPFVLLWVGALRVLDGAMSVGTMLALNALATATLNPLISVASSLQRLQLVAAHLERLTDVLDAKPEQIMGADLRHDLALTGRIELHDVNFRYQEGAPPTLRNISLTIEAGQTVALVGASGSGKSTLAKLLLGLYLPESGTICYDGIPIQHLNLRALRGNFGVVLQESFLFSASIRENIALNAPGIAFDRIVETTHLAAIHNEIAAMPMGYETRIAEGGGGLSGGQRQRLSIARALVHRPTILLLDEATSHLDVITERQIEANVRQLACTRIIIAHRLSTIRQADLILVLENGQIAERGTHETLLARDGLYARLVRSQTTDDESLPLALPERARRAVA